MEMFISLRAAEAADLFWKLAEAAAADTRDGAFEFKVQAEGIQGGSVVLIFNNDDMERPEMNGRTIIEVNPE
jgi:hypothetical protein